jgi:conserved oligomeric Golgi complex subunit 6
MRIYSMHQLFIQDANSNEVTPPPTILDHAQILRELLAVYSSSLLGSEAGTEDDAAEGFKRVLDVLLDPAIEMADVSAAEKKRRQPTWDASVFVINCLTFLQGVMEPYPFTAEKQHFVKSVVDEKIEALIVEHVRLFSVIFLPDH